MKFLSVCSGIEAASVAWNPLGWDAVGFSEIEPFPCAVLAHHYPDVPNFGDLTRYADWPRLAPDLVVGGTPCQSFSVAGLRQGLADPRGNLALVFLGLVDRLRPRWVVWENVPGVRSSSAGRDLGAFLGALGELGYGWAYGSLDAQFFGLAQRRERVFVVGHLGDWRPPAAVLLEPASLSGHPAPRRETGERITRDIAPSLRGGGPGAARVGDSRGQDPLVTLSHDPAPTLTARERKGPLREADLSAVVTHSLRADGFDASEDGTGCGTPLVAIDLQQVTSKVNRSQPSAEAPPLTAQGTVVAFGWQNSASQGDSVSEHITPALDKSKVPAVGVRRLTPSECERLQGFPDGWTLVPYRGKPAKDGPRYKALGNSMAVPVVRWIGQRIHQVEEVLRG